MRTFVFPGIRISSGSQAPAWEPETEAPASRDWKLELPGLHSQAGAWERVQIDRYRCALIQVLYPIEFHIPVTGFRHPCRNDGFVSLAEASC